METPAQTENNIEASGRPFGQIIKEAIPSRFNRLRFYGKAIVTWNRLNFAYMPRDIMSYHNQEDPAAYKSEMYEEFITEIGRWAVQKEIFTPGVQAQVISHHPELLHVE